MATLAKPWLGGFVLFFLSKCSSNIWLNSTEGALNLFSLTQLLYDGSAEKQMTEQGICIHMFLDLSASLYIYRKREMYGKELDHMVRRQIQDLHLRYSKSIDL